jgi:pimeloyl-ACP methyl ester carboxylesterase
MGGYGALNLAMLHPDVFGATYALSPGLFAKDGLSKNSMFASQNTIDQYLIKDEEFKEMEEDEAKVMFMSFITHLVIAVKDHDRVFSYAYGAAFSPNPNMKAPFIDYPYYKSDEEVILDTMIWKNYENGFGGLAEKIERYKDNFLTLKGITIDYGINDNYKWIPQGCEYFSELLKEADIPHNLVKFEGGHGDKVRERIEKYMLPFFSNILEFE